MICKICRDKAKRDEVDALLASGEGHREIAKLVGVSRSAVGRHHREHFAEAIGPGENDSRSVWTRIRQAAERIGDQIAAIRAQKALDRLDAEEKATTPKPTVELPPGQLRAQYVVAIREALGFSPASARAGVLGYVPERDEPLIAAEHAQQAERTPENLVTPNLALDNEIVERLKDCAARHLREGKVVMCCARLISLIQQEPLPNELEAEVVKWEANMDHYELNLEGGDDENEAEENDSDADRKETGE